MPARRRAFALVLTTACFLLATALALPAVAAAPASWGWPLGGMPLVDRPFQPPASAWGAGHRGVDLRGDLGEPVLAAGPGRVTYGGLLAGRGVVTVTHANGLRTTYEPLEVAVSVGELVAQGDVLGTLSSGHRACRAGTVCLHWGLLRGDTYLDPLGLVVAGWLRLLPLDGSTPPRAAPRRGSGIAPRTASTIDRETGAALRSPVTGTDEAGAASSSHPTGRVGPVASVTGLGLLGGALLGAVRHVGRRRRD